MIPEYTDILVRFRVRPCYNNYVTVLKHGFSVVPVTVETLLVRYYAARLDAVSEAENVMGTMLKTRAICVYNYKFRSIGLLRTG